MYPIAKIVTVSVALTMVCVNLIALQNRHLRPGDRSFLFFCTGWWVIIIGIYIALRPTFPAELHWIIQFVDMLGDGCLFAAAYALFTGKDLPPNSGDLLAIASATLILILFTVVAGEFGPQSNPSWQVFIMAPSQILACLAFLVLAIGGGKRFPDFKISIYMICGCYAILQPPAFYATFSEETYNSYIKLQIADYFNKNNLPIPIDIKYPSSQKSIGLALAAGKVSFLLLSLLILNSLGGRGIKKASYAATTISLILTVLIVLIKLDVITQALSQ